MRQQLTYKTVVEFPVPSRHPQKHLSGPNRRQQHFGMLNCWAAQTGSPPTRCKISSLRPDILIHYSDFLIALNALQGRNGDIPVATAKSDI